jgi:PHD/YefM family antitoxin component YafN of YafNO toxin-antitoxin module
VRQIKSSDAAGSLDEIIDAVQRDPIEIQSADGKVGVMISREALRRLIGPKAGIDPALLERLMARNTERFAETFRSLAEWEATHEPTAPDDVPAPTPQPGRRV